MANDKNGKKAPANGKKAPANGKKTPSLGSGMAEKAKKDIVGYYARQKKMLDEI